MAKEGFPTVYDSKATRAPGVGVTDAGGPSLAKQEFKKESDINTIMARYKRTGVLPVGVGVGRYGDFSEVGEYRDALEVISKAEAQFSTLPSKVRDRFRNSPALMLEFIQNKDNLKEARELGLLKDEPIKAPEPEAKP